MAKKAESTKKEESTKKVEPNKKSQSNKKEDSAKKGEPTKALDSDRELDVESISESNILSLIEEDHREVEQLFEEFDSAKGRRLQTLFNQIYMEMTLHAHAEELSFYPAMREYEETAKFIEEAEQEHNSVKILLEQMHSLKPGDAEFKTKMSHLKESMLHHIEEEEEEIFPVVTDCMDEAELEKLGQEFQAVKERWRADLQAAMKK